MMFFVPQYLSGKKNHIQNLKRKKKKAGKVTSSNLPGEHHREEDLF